jgi:hypothetical protein
MQRLARLHPRGLSTEVRRTNIRKVRAVLVAARPDSLFLGVDIRKDSISAWFLDRAHERPGIEKIVHDDTSVRRLIDRFLDRSRRVSCLDAGPSGYDLARSLKSLGCTPW